MAGVEDLALKSGMETLATLNVVMTRAFVHAHPVAGMGAVKVERPERSEDDLDGDERRQTI